MKDIIMREYLLYFCLFVVLVSCDKQTYTGEIIEDDPELYQTEAMPVLLSIGEMALGEVSKGSGGFEPLNGKNGIDSAIWKNSLFYIYAFDKNCKDMRAEWKDAQNDNEMQCLIDATRPNKGSVKMGKAACLNESDFRTLEWVEDSTVVYYNTLDYFRSYDFFAYYVDDLSQDNIQREKERIHLEVIIDGQNDLMGAKAELTESQLAFIAGKSNATELLEHCYSTYAANNDINPNFSFEHYLCKIRVELYPGGDLKDRVEHSACYQTRILEVGVDSKYKGDMTVATLDEDNYPLGIVFGAETNRLYLVHKIFDEFNNIVSVKSEGQLQYMAGDENIEEPLQRSPYAMDGVLFLAPTTFLDVNLQLRNVNDSRLDETVSLRLASPDGEDAFYGGKAYVVKIIVYGNQSVEAIVESEEWKDGGEIFVDPDLDVFEK